MFKSMTARIILALARQAMTLTAGALAVKGTMSGDKASLLVSSVVGLASVIGSVVDKKKSVHIDS